MTHDLKCWPEYFRPIMSGQMMACLRVNDRNYRVGDTLRLNEYVPGGFGYTGDFGFVVITHVVIGGPHVPEGLALLSLKLIKDENDG